MIVQDKVNSKNLRWKILECDKGLDCLHCKYERAEKSIPKENFIVKRFDKSGKSLPDRLVKEIRVIRGRHDDAVGWFF